MQHHSEIAAAIDQAPFNMGVSGADWLLCSDNIAVAFANGDLALFEGDSSGAFEVHFLFVSGGREAINNARESFDVLFRDHKANLIFGMVPDHRRDVKLLARWAGGKSAGKRNTAHGVCELFVLSGVMRKGKK